MTVRVGLPWWTCILCVPWRSLRYGWELGTCRRWCEPDVLCIAQQHKHAVTWN